MSKVTMPEPVAWMLAYQTMGGDVGWKLSWTQSGAGVCHRLSGESHEKPLITTTQAEAYADARVREVQQWVSVEDRLPDPETDVLVKVYGGKFGARTHDIAGLFRDEWMSQITEDIVRGCVTHWMPLPAPPTE